MKKIQFDNEKIYFNLTMKKIQFAMKKISFFLCNLRSDGQL